MNISRKSLNSPHMRRQEGEGEDAAKIEMSGPGVRSVETLPPPRVRATTANPLGRRSLLPPEVSANIFHELMAGDLSGPSVDMFEKSRVWDQIEELSPGQVSPQPADRRVYNALSERCKQAGFFVSNLAVPPQRRQLEAACKLIPWISPEDRSRVVEMCRMSNELHLLGGHRAMLSKFDVEHLMQAVGTRGPLSHQESQLLEELLTDTSVPLPENWVRAQIERLETSPSARFLLTGKVFQWFKHASQQVRRSLIDQTFVHGSLTDGVHYLLESWSVLDDESRQQVIQCALNVHTYFKDKVFAAVAVRAADMSTFERSGVASWLEETHFPERMCAEYARARREFGSASVDTTLEDLFIDRALAVFDTTGSWADLAVDMIAVIPDRIGSLQPERLQRLMVAYQAYAESTEVWRPNFYRASAALWRHLTAEQKDSVLRGSTRNGIWMLSHHVGRLDRDTQEYVVNKLNMRYDEEESPSLYRGILTQIHLLSTECANSVLVRLEQLTTPDFTDCLEILRQSVHARRLFPPPREGG